MVGFGAAWFTAKQTQASEARNKQQHETELQIANDNQREKALQNCIDKISELLLHEHLGESPLNPQVEIIARARTVTALRILDSVRRGSLIRFLSQAGILTKCTKDELMRIDLHGANLTQVNLRKINLRSANLNGADLMLASFNGADLSDTSTGDGDFGGLSGADLRKANLSEANLSEALLNEDTISIVV